MNWNPHKTSEIERVLRERGLWLARSRGQNYLVDRDIASRIVSCVPVTQPVLEVGCGLGALTVLLPPRRVYALEVDHGIFSLVSELISHPCIQLREADFLRFDLDSLGEQRLFFLSNLPYSISGEAIRRFIDERVFEEGIVMVQKEFFERMIVPVGEKNYGVFAVLVQSFLEVDKLFMVPKGCFFPVPSVDSVVIRIRKKMVVMGKRREDFAPLQESFRAFLLKGFGSKRKTLFNNLRSKEPKERVEMVLREVGVGGEVRPEEVSVEQWQKLFLAMG
ncbi:MAG: 16S rRNA (adenine(1518)-N(6)/adenine(1519)-N(6))-dimethyltransferase RsmA [Brevinematales bacterium]|nr:16S rRNA (adenine(1518)-N(6)/adenine(1519)-N(6))-dimethyltransferase RsmA [Brevinematales bacterium]